MMTGWYVNRVHETASGNCRCCGHQLAFVDEVGWVDLAGGSYDMCEGDSYGNHQPEPVQRTL